MFIPTYRFLDRALRVGPLTVAQWLQLALALLVSFGLSRALAVVMPASWALSSAITLVGCPLAVVWVAVEADFDAFTFLRSFATHRRGPRLLLPGTDPAVDPHGYRIVARGAAPRPDAASTSAVTSPLEEDLWHLS